MDFYHYHLATLVGYCAIRWRFFLHTFTSRSICSFVKWYGTHVDETYCRPKCSVKILWILDFEIWSIASSDRVDVWRSSSIAATTLLILTWVMTVGLLPLWEANPTISHLLEYLYAIVLQLVLLNIHHRTPVSLYHKFLPAFWQTNTKSNHRTLLVLNVHD